MCPALLIPGAILEFLGILSVAAADLVPYGRQISAWLGRQYDRTPDRLRRLLRRPRHYTLDAEPGRYAVAGAPAGLDSSADRDEKTQRDLEALHTRISALDAEMVDRIAAALDEAHGEYHALRLLGVGLLVVALFLTTAANFV